MANEQSRLIEEIKQAAQGGVLIRPLPGGDLEALCVSEREVSLIHFYRTLAPEGRQAVYDILNALSGESSLADHENGHSIYDDLSPTWDISEEDAAIYRVDAHGPVGRG